MIHTLTFATRCPVCHDITDQIAAYLRDSGAQDGALTLFVRHTSCSLLIQENAEPDVQRDLLPWLDRIASSADHPSIPYLTHRTEGPDDMPAHLKVAVLPVSLSIPIRAGRIMLGTWQSVFLVEHRTAPHHREIVLALQQL